MYILLSLLNFFDFYYILFYSTQKYLSNILFSLSNENSVYSLVIVFLLGILTILTPCLISILPLALSYINSDHNYTYNIVSFICGLFTSFCLLIVFTNFLNFSFLLHKLPIISYIILMIVSLNLMDILNFPNISVYVDKYFNNTFVINSRFQSYLMGFIISLSALPCNTSCLILFTFILQNMNSLLYSLLCCGIYFFGCLLPLLLIFKVNFNNIDILMFSYLWKLLFPISGSFLFVFSCFSLLKVIFI